MKVAAIIPAYNEEEHIARVIQDTKKYVDKVIVVDDGSTDKTYQEAEKVKPDILLKHPINSGKGLALKTGIEAALIKNMDIIITLDSDGQHNPADIPRFLEYFKKNKLDLLIGARKLNKNMPIVFKIGNYIIQKTFKILFGVDVKDTQSGFRILKTKIYKKIIWNSTGYSVEAEMLANAGKHKLKIGELPIKTVYHDKAKGTTVIDGVVIVLNMLRWRLTR
ncbi:glycosyltransferase family 2 protein [Candidatus Woesearchaeota archaeon]|nr:MAG: glycosyltransferase family 2 protein [Candidatus Woesearchaeota archaeon]